MEKNKKQVSGVSSIRIDPDLMEEARGLDKQYYSLSRIVEDYLTLRKQAMREIKNVFSEKELKYMFDMLNGVFYTSGPINPVQALEISIRESNEYDELGSKWEVSPEGLVRKIREIGNFNCHILTCEIKAAWKEHKAGAIEKFVEKHKGDK